MNDALAERSWPGLTWRPSSGHGLGLIRALSISVSPTGGSHQGQMDGLVRAAWLQGFVARCFREAVRHPEYVPPALADVASEQERRGWSRHRA